MRGGREGRRRSARPARAAIAVAVALVAVSVLSVGPAAGAALATGDAGTGADAADGDLTAVDENVLAAGGDASGVEAGADGPTLRFAYELERLPERPGVIRATATVAPPDSVTAVTVEPPANATVERTDGFEPTGDGDELVWDREAASTGRPALTYAVGVNETTDGSLSAVDTGDWALFNWRRVDLDWRYTHTADDPPTTVERATAVGDGVAGPGLAYLGPARTVTRTVEGETLRVVVPEAADPAEPPAAVADALAAAASDFRIGGRSERVTVVAAPAPVGATGRVVTAGDGDAADLYVAADAPLDTADNAWFHEYVHTRQTYETGERTAWLDEGSAEYFAALLAYRTDRIAAGAFYEYVRTGRESDAVLADAEPTASASYFKGMRVLAAADAKVRDASDGEATLENAFRRLNDREDTVTLPALAAALSSAGDGGDGPSAEWVEARVESRTAPTVPPYLNGTGAAVTEPTGALGVLSSAPVLGGVLFALAVAVAGLRLREE